jgi:hypothetical protein
MENTSKTMDLKYINAIYENTENLEESDIA